MTAPPRSRSWPPLGLFTGYAAAALALGALFALGWKLREILMLAFGAIVIAAILRAMARPLISRHPKHEKLGVLGAVLALALFLGGVGWIFGHQISGQMSDLGQRLPQAAAQAREKAEQNAVGRFVLGKMPEDGGGMAALKQAVTVTLKSISHALLMLVAGIYLALDPRLYAEGLSRLFPPPHRRKIGDALAASGDSLQRWLLGQLVSMATIGSLTAAGLALVGCPAPLALGILAGLLVFVPVVGFVVAFVPVVLVALSESSQVAIAAIVVFLVVQQLEEQVVQPLAQKWATALPPALGLIALAAMGVLFGIPGLIFGAPLTVVIMCLVRELYLKHGIEN